MPPGDCFRCQQPGHWIKDCPLTTPTKSSDSSLSSSPPLIHCPCDAGACNLLTSRSKENPNRKFYQCPAVPSCRFFKWCDQVSIKSSPLSNHVVCPCGSGPCRRVSVIAGPNAGRSYFICQIKKSFGNCGFFQWEDAQIPSQPGERHSDSPCSIRIGFPNFDSTDDDNSVAGTDLISTSHGMVTPENSIPSNESTRDGIAECSSSIKPPMSSVTAEEESIPVCSRFNNLELVARNELASANSKTQGVSPSFDPITAYKDAVPLETGNQVLPSLDPKHSEEPQVETSSVDQPRSSAPLKLTGKESYALEVVEAKSILGTTGPPDNTSNPFLTGSFVKNGTNIPEHQSTSGETEASFSGSSFLNLIELFNSEKLRFESVSLKHAKALTAFTGSFKQLESLRDKENSLKKHLLEVEKQVAACEAETSDYATSLQEVSGEMLESQKKMVETAGKVAKELGVYKANGFCSFDLK